MKTGVAALALSLGGLLLVILIGMAGHPMDRPFKNAAYLLFLGFQIAALVVGFPVRRNPWGKAALIVSPVLVVVSLLAIS